MSKRTCSECVYAIQPTKGQWLKAMMSRWPCGLTCLNHAECPGVLRDTWPGGTCRNFRAKGERQPRATPPEPPNDEVRYIPLTQGKHAIVDASDYEWLSKYRWFTVRVRGGCYAATSIKGEVVFMHRLITNAPKGKVVDHIDGTGLNNRRSNLRNCTRRENARNRRATSKGATSQYLGVYRRKDVPDKWFAVVRCCESKVYLGPFDDEIEAARARDRVALELHGEFASLNFPEEAQPDDPSSNQR